MKKEKTKIKENSGNAPVIVNIILRVIIIFAVIVLIKIFVLTPLTDYIIDKIPPPCF